MRPADGRTDELVAEAQRIQELLSATAGELGVFVKQLREMTSEVREENEAGDG